MTNAKTAEEKAFKKRYSRFKVHIFFNHRSSCTFYGQERYGCSIPQIKFHRVTQVILDREKGLQTCLNQIDVCERLYGKSSAACIYDKLKITTKPDGSTEPWGEVMKIVNGIVVEQDTEILAPKDRKIICKVEHQAGEWKLTPLVSIPDTPIEKIDFKAEVAKALTQTEKP